MSALTEQRTRHAVVNATPTDYVTELLLLPDRIRVAEASLNATESLLASKRLGLKLEEARLIAEGDCPGKNKEEREAHLLLATENEHRDIARLEAIREERRITLRFHQNRFSAFRAIVRYLAREGDNE